MKNNKKGFTLAELLVVVAIIGILVAVSIPIFTAQREKAYLATNQANARAAKAAATAQWLLTDPQPTVDKFYAYTTATGQLAAASDTATVTGGVDAGNTDPSTWTVDATPGSTLKTATYKTVEVKIDKTGAVVDYNFGK